MSVPGIDRPFKQPNTQFPPDKDVLALIQTHLLQNMVARNNNVDCSEIAEKLYARASNGTIVYYAEPDFKWPDRESCFNPATILDKIKIPEKEGNKIITAHYCYHAIFSDGRYIYDPVLSSDAIVKSEYSKLIKSLNPKGLSSRYTFGNAYFHKGEFSR